MKLSSIKKFGAILLLFIVGNTLQAFNNAPLYLNRNAPVKDRVADLMKRMTLAEKIAQMCQFAGFDHIRNAENSSNKKELKDTDITKFYPGLRLVDVEQMIRDGKIGSFLHVTSAKEANELQALAQKSRLKIPLLIGIDAIHGNGLVAGSTVFPSPIGLSCTWDTALVKQISHITAVEMRATGTHWAFSPNLDIARDARWGRTGETFGEDPFLVTAMGMATIQGLQGINSTGTNAVLACAKHLIAGSEPVNGLNKAPTDLSERTLNEIYLPPFKAAVDAGVYSVMPAHNEINGIPCHANGYLMETLLRKQWGFKGMYVSDYMDIERLVQIHHVALTQKEAVYQTVIAGMDMHMQGPGFLEPLTELVNEGRISEARIDSSVSRILEAKFKLGLFEDPFVGNSAGKVFTKLHTGMSLQAARKSIVLLKNNGILPLKPNEYTKILVTGPNAANQAMLGDWSLKQPDENITTVLEGIKQQAGPGTKVTYFNSGTAILSMDSSRVAQAAKMAKEADLVIVVAGDNSLRFEKDRTAGENVDRDNIGLPGLQQSLIEQLHQTGKPVVVVLINGRPLSVPWIDKNIPAVVEAWEPGCFGGEAIANVLFGKVNPSGKLTVSVVRNAGQVRNFYNHKPSQFVRQYIDSENGALYPFGHGLSYTTFAYGQPVLSKTSINSNGYTEATVEVGNTGKRAGEEVVQLYINGSVSVVTKPVLELKGFKRIFLKPGEKRKVTFRITQAELMSYRPDNTWGVEPGEFKVMTGPSSADKNMKMVKLMVLSAVKH